MSIENLTHYHNREKCLVVHFDRVTLEKYALKGNRWTASGERYDRAHLESIGALSRSATVVQTVPVASTAAPIAAAAAQRTLAEQAEFNRGFALAKAIADGEVVDDETHAAAVARMKKSQGR